MRIIRGVLIYLAGALSGWLLYSGYLKYISREGNSIGGEALILPLMFLLFYAGWSVRNEIGRSRESRAFVRGSQEGIRRLLEGQHPNCRHIYRPYRENHN